MDHARKMVLIPPNMLQSLQGGPSTSTHHPLDELDEKMRTILDRKDLNVHDKATMYSQYLQTFLKTSDNLRKPLPIEVRDVQPLDIKDEMEVESLAVKDREQSDPIELEIIQHIPKSFVNRAHQLIQKLKINPSVGWTSAGQLVIHGRPVKGSNLCDLMYDIFRERRGYVPSGSEQFMRLLAEMNVPETLLSNPKRRQDLQRWKRLDGMEEEKEEDSLVDRNEKVAKRAGPGTFVNSTKSVKERERKSNIDPLSQKWMHF